MRIFNTKHIPMSRPENQSAGILDDFAVRKNLATREGTIEKVPVFASDIVNKNYIDGIYSEIVFLSGMNAIQHGTFTNAYLLINSNLDYLSGANSTEHLKFTNDIISLSGAFYTLKGDELLLWLQNSNAHGAIEDNHLQLSGGNANRNIQIGNYYLSGAGIIGNGTISGASFKATSTTEQLKLSYDGTNNAAFTVGSTGILTINPTLYISIPKRFIVDYDSAGTATQNALTFYHDVTPTGNTGFTFRGMQGFTRTYSSNNFTGACQGFQGGVIHNGSGLVSSAIGGDFYCYAVAGNMTSAYAANLQIYTDAGKTITNGRGLNISTPINAGTLTNTHAIYIASQKNGTQTNTAYGIYQAGTDDDNTFLGDLSAATLMSKNGYTGTGSYTNFTISGGLILAAS